MLPLHHGRQAQRWSQTRDSNPHGAMYEIALPAPAVCADEQLREWPIGESYAKRRDLPGARSARARARTRPGHERSEWPIGESHPATRLRRPGSGSAGQAHKGRRNCEIGPSGNRPRSDGTSPAREARGRVLGRGRHERSDWPIGESNPAAWFRRPGSGSTGQAHKGEKRRTGSEIRTRNLRGLGPLPLPVELRRRGAWGGSRTRMALGPLGSEPRMYTVSITQAWKLRYSLTESHGRLRLVIPALFC